MIINGKEYKKIISMCSKCHFISNYPYLEPKNHYLDNGRVHCGAFELVVEIDSERKTETEPFNQK